METTLPALTPMQETLFLTLCGRALDDRSTHPILPDTMAGDIVRELDYDCEKVPPQRESHHQYRASGQETR